MPEKLSVVRKTGRKKSGANGEMSRTATPTSEPSPRVSETAVGATEQSPLGPQAPKPPTANEICAQIRTLVRSESPYGKRAEICGLVTQLLKTVMASHPAASRYNWLIIHDSSRMVRKDADRIYAAINGLSEAKEIALIITSSGGQIEPAYLISKLCREATTGKFIAVVPRRAKSAATLVACGADEIHMSQMSELGPIDPQIDELPALGLKNAIEHLAELSTKYPEASEMFASYLTKSLKLVNLGYYERVAESAMQYAVRLLNKRVTPLGGEPNTVARQLVYGYKDHGFVIDQAEATEIFGDAMIKVRTVEYALGNTVYEWLSWIERVFDMAKYRFYMYGSVESECNFFEDPVP